LQKNRFAIRPPNSYCWSSSSPESSLKALGWTVVVAAPVRRQIEQLHRLTRASDAIWTSKRTVPQWHVPSRLSALLFDMATSRFHAAK
jgi:hypothetical protein